MEAAHTAVNHRGDGDCSSQSDTGPPTLDYEWRQIPRTANDLFYFVLLMIAIRLVFFTHYNSNLTAFSPDG